MRRNYGKMFMIDLKFCRFLLIVMINEINI